ncbi:MAG: DUF2063 domain-containing protein [Gammaproteobacteria bacterium HGW-Gammaproteobacteria-14]|nr:MAG: DUF2063 domain-containing protein [Gammaproteobacteria bacterium HGW-Gammaproteobacteria-14]
MSALLDSQRRFSAHLRDPDNHAAPEGIEDRRLAIYRDLFWRNIEGFLSAGFPVLRSLLNEDDWHYLVRRFFADHRCDSGYFVDIPEQFLNWLSEGFRDQERYPPFLLELAYYEWLELALEVSTEEIPLLPNSQGDVWEGCLVVSPLCALMAAQWPVHQIAADAIPEIPLETPVWLLVWRDRADQVHFMELNAATARLVQLLQEGEPITGTALLARLAEEMGQEPMALKPFLSDIIDQLRRRDIILGHL